MVRCFIGILLPDSLKNAVSKIQDFIRTLDAECRFVEYENLHISLSFLGDMPDNEILKIQQKLDEVVGNYRKFSLLVSGIKFIPTRSYIRVIALDVVDDSGVLVQITDKIKTNVGGDVKPPHLTLCRVKKIADKLDVISRILNSNTYCGELEVDSINLIKSELKPTGPVYSVLHKSSLK